MAKTMLLRREGFWAPSWADDRSRLPYPHPYLANAVTPWKGKGGFLTALSKAENTAEKMTCRGSSPCRLCQNRFNGNCEYLLDGWVWPQGFRHYVADHNIRPSLAFEEFILQRELD